MQWKDIDLPRMGGAYLISLLQSIYTIKVIYRQAVNFMKETLAKFVTDLASLFHLTQNGLFAF